MRLVVEPERLKNLLSSVLKYGSTKGVESTTASFSPERIDFADLSLEVVAVRASFDKKYFLEYQAEQESFPLTQTLLNALSHGFKDEKITLEKDGNKLILKGGSETYTEPLSETGRADFPIKMTETDSGFLPENMDPAVSVMVSADELKGLPSADKYRFQSDGKTLKVIVQNTGEYTKNLKTKGGLLKDLTVSFDGEYFRNTVNNLSGDIGLMLSQKALVLTKKAKDHQLTYMIAPLSED